MAQICETRADEARASRNSLGGCFRDLNSRVVPYGQPLPDLIALHLGADWLSGWTVGREA